MAMDDRIESLKTKHADLEEQITLENARPHPDDSLIHDLKKQKLRIKDELAKLAHA
jgi:hypothetical protein